MKLICPNKSFFSDWLKLKIQKKFECKIGDLNEKNFNKEAHNYEIVLLRAKSFLKYTNQTYLFFYMVHPVIVNNLQVLQKHQLYKQHDVLVKMMLHRPPPLWMM